MTTVVEPLTECRSPYCHEPPATGRRFCAFHVEIFDRVAAEDKQRREKVRGSIGRKGARSTCCRPGCREPRPKTEQYCIQCRDEGYGLDYD